MSRRFSTSLGLLANSLKRHWPLWLVFALAWVLGLILPVANVAATATETGYPYSLANLMVVEWVAGWAGCIVASVVCALVVFEPLFKSESAIFHGGLPVGRKALFATMFSMGLVPMLLIEVGAFLVLVALSVVYPALGVSVCLSWLAIVVCCTFTCFSVAVFAAQLTGSRAIAVVLYLVFNGAIVGCEYVVRLLATALLVGFSSLGEMLTLWAAPAIGLLRYVIFANTFELLPELPGTQILAESIGWGALVGYCIFALVLAVVSSWVFGRRELEAAGSVMAFDAVRAPIKYAMGVCVALVFGFVGYLFSNISNIQMGFGDLFVPAAIIAGMLALGACLGLLFAEMILSRSTNVWRRVWKGAAVLCLVFVLAVVVCVCDTFGVASYVPRAVEVESVYVGGLGTHATFTDEADLDTVADIHQNILATLQGSSGDKTSDADDADTRSVTASVELVYALKSGEEVSRLYTVDYDTRVDDEGIYTLDESSTYEGTLAVRDLVQLLSSASAAKDRFGAYMDGTAKDVTIELEAYDETKQAWTSYTLSSVEVAEFIEEALTPDVMDNGAIEGNVSLLYNAEIDDYLVASLYLFGDDATGASINVSLHLSPEHTPNIIAWFQDHYGLELTYTGAD